MKSRDRAEAIANAVIGLAVSWCVVRLLWPLMGWPVDAARASGVTGLFFILSTLRAYALRRLFRHWEALRP